MGLIHIMPRGWGAVCSQHTLLREDAELSDWTGNATWSGTPCGPSPQARNPRIETKVDTPTGQVNR